MPTVNLLLRGFTLFSEECSLGLSAICLVRGDRTILVDTGHGGHRRPLLKALELHSIAPEAVELVVLTHLHWDHILNVDLFPSATFLVHEDELRAARCGSPPDIARPGFAAAALDQYPLATVRGETILEPGIRLMEVPGHSPGHIALPADTPDGTAAICGDALPDMWSAIHKVHTFASSDAKAAARSIERILAAATLIYPGHDRPFRCGSGSPVYLGESHDLHLWAQSTPSTTKLTVATSTAPDGTQQLVWPRQIQERFAP